MRRKTPFPVCEDQNRVVRYWHDALRTSEAERVTRYELGKDSEEVNLSDIRGGFLHPNIYEKLRSDPHSPEPSDSQELEVILCPLRLRQSDQNSPGPNSIDCFWIPALLRSDGELKPSPSQLPWIPRAHLEPVFGENVWTLGDVEDYERYIRKQRPATKQWQEYWLFCDGLFTYVTDSSLNSCTFEGYKRQSKAVAVRANSQPVYRALLNIYEEVLEKVRHPGLLQRVASRRASEKTEFLGTWWSACRAAKKHLGQMGDAYSLAYSQRLALQAFSETPVDDFLCVTGPPGTGKTTLIQSVVATIWVEAALKKQASPPLIVATGATNQSVTNILDSFGAAASRQGALAERWLPDVRSYGNYCASGRKEEQAAKYHYELRNGKGFSSMVETHEYLEKATEYFLSRASSFAEKQLSLDAVISLLHRNVKQEVFRMQAEIRSISENPFISYFKLRFGYTDKEEVGANYEKFAAADIDARHRAFLFATHYWEACWLREMAKTLDRWARHSPTPPKYRNSLQDWQRRSMLTPVFVSTLEMTGKFFKLHRGAEKPPIDLLIVDEAGQVSPELGAACLALARKALIVGDDQQLEPIWNLSEYIDKQIAMELGLESKKEKHWETLTKLGVLASSGNLMKLAIRKSKRTYHEQSGVFLSEHRRSTPEIVEFCNGLSYGSRLIAKREKRTPGILPTFGFRQIAGVCERKGKSRVNHLEAQEILQWIRNEEVKLCAFYDRKPMDQIVAVISPFAAQIQELRRLIRPRYPKMIVGTVHSLQGAEIPVVLFSPTYDTTVKNLHFMDMRPNMLNVAVSRAKDSFLVFGNMNALSSDLRQPSGLLRSFLTRFTRNQLAPASSTSPPLPRLPDSVEVITSLEAHRAVIPKALAEAKHRVIIVSAFVSSYAILADHLPERIATAVRRGVEVRIYVDAESDLRNGKLKPRALEGRRLLREAGAKVFETKGIHNKVVCIDDTHLIVGSFNWLSAVRDEKHEHSKFEQTLSLQGGSAREDIANLLQEMEVRRLDKFQRVQNF